MRKQDQVKINSFVEEVWNQAISEFHNEYGTVEPVRLRSCKAYVFETTHYYFLQSYNTLVACIDKTTDTSTSAQHISKFDTDYGKGKFGCEGRVTWREV